MHNIRAICFDLDNTLWDVDPVIARAERVLYAWYQENYPQVTERFTRQDILAIRNRMIQEMPEFIYDLARLRMAALTFIAEQSGYAAGMADEAFEVFQHERNAVTLYDDVLPALQALAQTHELLSLSNGNADLEIIGIAHFFKHRFTAREMGMAKPDVGVYATVCRESGFAPGELLHVGDNPDNDIVAAAKAGWRTVWVNRNAADWQHAEHEPDHITADLRQLTQLFNREQQ